MARHFVAYHNAAKMGRSLTEGDPFRLLSNKPLKHLESNVVWFIEGEAGERKQYALASVFIVDEIGENADSAFKNFAAGRGCLIQPPVLLNDLDWFKNLFQRSAHFSLGVVELNDRSTITELSKFAAEAGLELPADEHDNSSIEAESVRQYPVKSVRKLSSDDKVQIRSCIHANRGDIYELAEAFNCSSSQIAGIKASMTRDGASASESDQAAQERGTA